MSVPEHLTCDLNDVSVHEDDDLVRESSSVDHRSVRRSIFQTDDHFRRIRCQLRFHHQSNPRSRGGGDSQRRLDNVASKQQVSSVLLSSVPNFLEAVQRTYSNIITTSRPPNHKHLPKLNDQSYIH
jgi:hypothetical protein